MTSEICVMNRRALVLAADSAATVTQWSGQKEEVRYFKGSNKIFQLSALHPIGAMIFDAADLHGMPWEVIVKEFRTRLGKRCFPNVSDYADAFFKFVAEDRTFFSQDYLDEVLISNIDRAMIRPLTWIRDDDKVRRESDPDVITRVSNEVFREIVALWDKRPLAHTTKQTDLSKIKKRHKPRLLREAELNLELFGQGIQCSPQELLDIGLSLLFKMPTLFLSNTGIVVAGYGDRHFFPCYEEYTCAGFLGYNLLFSKKGEQQIGRTDAGHVKAFATTNMVDTFTLGFAPDVFSSVRTNLGDVLKTFAESVSGQNVDAIPDLEKKMADTVQEHTSRWTKAMLKQHAEPMRGVIGSLPIDEMADLAETMIMLESLKEKVTRPSESVGGPIDVAIITKHEGFVWAKRKHFFDAELNPRYFIRQSNIAAKDQDDAEGDSTVLRVSAGKSGQ